MISWKAIYFYKNNTIYKIYIIKKKKLKFEHDLTKIYNNSFNQMKIKKYNIDLFLIFLKFNLNYQSSLKDSFVY